MTLVYTIKLVSITFFEADELLMLQWDETTSADLVQAVISHAVQTMKKFNKSIFPIM